MLDSEQRDRLRQYLVLSEGLRVKPYLDTVGKWSIGIGRNLTDVGISISEAYDLLAHDLDRAYVALVSAYPWFPDQDPVRQVVLVELCFNLGAARLAQFTTTLRAFEQKDYLAAVDGLTASKWYRQVQPTRSARLLRMTVTGEWA